MVLLADTPVWKKIRCSVVDAIYRLIAKHSRCSNGGCMITRWHLLRAALIIIETIAHSYISAALFRHKLYEASIRSIDVCSIVAIVPRSALTERRPLLNMPNSSPNVKRRTAWANLSRCYISRTKGLLVHSVTGHKTRIKGRCKKHTWL